MEKQTQQSNETTPVVQSQPGELGPTRTGLGGTIIALQHAAGNQAVLGLLNARLGSSDSSNRNGGNGHSLATGQDTTHSSVKSLSSAPQVIQRSPNGNDAGKSPEKSHPVGLIVDDKTQSLGPGQMRKRDFLTRLRTSVCATADEALAQAGRSAKGCPYIEKWISYYSDQEPAYIERALRKYAPESSYATSAEEYITAVNNRVRRAVNTWVRTGEITGVPDELRSLLPGGGAIASLEGLISMGLQALVSGIGSAISAVAGAVGGFFSNVGRMLFKQKQGATNSAQSPEAVKAQLTGGQTLDGSVRSRMSAAFGRDFSGVRVHTGSRAAALSEQMNARAFAVGSDIAFASGEYQPGTLVGDALIAHELAHVTQQQGGVHTSGQNPGSESHSFETEADDAAVDAVISIWGTKGSPIRRIGQGRSSLKSGLRLQRCGADTSDPELKSYLAKLEGSGIQKGFYDDDRARAVVKRWKAGAKDFDLTPHVKYLLIQEMLDGSTGGDDERAILDLLEYSDNGDLRMIFAQDQLSPQQLDKKIDGDNYKELLAFYEQRFDGGRAALIQGRVSPKGAPKKDAPRFAYSWENLRRRLFGIPYLPQDVAQYIRSLTPAEQARARQDLNSKRLQYQKLVDQVTKTIEQKATAAAQAAGKKPADMTFKEIFDAAPGEMGERQKDLTILENMESVLYALGIETAKLGPTAVAGEAVAPTTQAQKDAIKQTLIPPQAAATGSSATAPGQAATFNDPTHYEAELKTATKKLIDGYYKLYVQNVNRANLYPLSRLAEIANAGRAAVDSVFKDWAQGPEFEPGVNLLDRFVEVETKFQSIPPRDRPAALKQIARDHVMSMMPAEKDLREVHRKFLAVPDFDENGVPQNDVARIQLKIAKDIASTDAQRVFEIMKGWPGGHREGKIKLQTTKQPAGDKERTHFWYLFQASIHEYVHSLMNGSYRTFAESFPGKDKSRQFNTLVEGMASVLHEIVWQAILPRLNTPEIRDKVEGPDYSKKPFDKGVIPDIKRIRYSSYEEAQALIARVGITNLLLAFFKGRVDLIGG